VKKVLDAGIVTCYTSLLGKSDPGATTAGRDATPYDEMCVGASQLDGDVFYNSPVLQNH
jgi:hypothetical protein